MSFCKNYKTTKSKKESLILWCQDSGHVLNSNYFCNSCEKVGQACKMHKRTMCSTAQSAWTPWLTGPLIAEICLPACCPFFEHFAQASLSLCNTLHKPRPRPTLIWQICTSSCFFGGGRNYPLQTHSLTHNYTTTMLDLRQVRKVKSTFDGSENQG